MSRLYKFEHLKLDNNYDNLLDTPLTVSNPVADNLTWLLDVIVDSRAEVIETKTLQNGKQTSLFSFAPRFSQGNLTPLMNARLNVERILSDILGKEVCFELNMRAEKTSGRFRIVEKKTGTIVIPSFDSLSTGQMALFNLFTTIIRYADYNDLNKSIQLSNISGIVVVDEIELHLHSNLQAEILPKLIKRFPKVQFIATSHAPFFVLGMEKLFGPEGFELYQMPDGCKIGAEMFSEFQKAYEYLSSTQKYQSEITAEINGLSHNPLVVTEGKTDWIHLKAAYSYLKTIERHQNLFRDMDIEFLEYESDMGDSQLCTLCKNTAKVKRNNIVIFIADADKPIVTKDLAGIQEHPAFDKEAVPYRFHSLETDSKTYSFVLPLPPFRESTPLISIEHYYSDEAIKCEIECPDGIHRRLYMGGEFDSTGMGDGIRCGKKSFNKCGDSKIEIIDDDVFKAEKGNVTNIALTKKVFAEKIASRQPPFEKEEFESFVAVFKVIRQILVAGGAINDHNYSDNRDVSES